MNAPSSIQSFFFVGLVLCCILYTMSIKSMVTTVCSRFNKYVNIKRQSVDLTKP